MPDPPDRDALRAPLVARVRAFEWEVARRDDARAIAGTLREISHDLLNFVQVADLTAQALAPHQQPPLDEFVADLGRTAREAKTKLRELSTITHAALDRPVIRTEVEPVARATFDELRAAGVSIASELAVGAEDRVAWTADELAGSLLVLALEPRCARLQVTAVTVANRELVELRCIGIGATSHAVVVVSAVAIRAGGSVRLDGDQLTIAIPVVA